MCNRSQIWSSWLPPPQLKDPTSWGGGHPLAGGPASRTEHGERTAQLPARALNPSVHRAGAAVPLGEARCLSLTAAPDPGHRPEGTVPSRFEKGRGSWGDEVIGVVTGRCSRASPGSLQPSWRGQGECRVQCSQPGGLTSMGVRLRFPPGKISKDEGKPADSNPEVTLVLPPPHPGMCLRGLTPSSVLTLQPVSPAQPGSGPAPWLATRESSQACSVCTGALTFPARTSWRPPGPPF